MLQQSSSLGNSSLNGTMVIEDQYLDGGTSPTAMVGLIVANGSGSVTSGSADVNDPGQGGLSTQSFAGATYSVDSSTGRMTVAGGGGHPPVFYVVTTNEAFMVGTGGSPDFGMLLPQSGGPTYTNSSLSGLFLGGTEAPVSWSVDTEVDSVTLNNGTVTGTYDGDDGSGGPGQGSISGSSCPSSGAGNFSCTDNSTGRFLICSTAGCPSGSVEVILYVVSPSQAVVMDASSGDSNPRVTDFHQ